MKNRIIAYILGIAASVGFWWINMLEYRSIKEDPTIPKIPRIVVDFDKRIALLSGLSFNHGRIEITGTNSSVVLWRSALTNTPVDVLGSRIGYKTLKTTSRRAVQPNFVSIGYCNFVYSRPIQMWREIEPGDIASVTNAGSYWINFGKNP